MSWHPNNLQRDFLWVGKSEGGLSFLIHVFLYTFIKV